MKNGYVERWAKAAAVRALKTMAQTAVATVGTSTIIATVDWKVVASASVVAGVLSLLTSVAGLPEVEEQRGLRLSFLMQERIKGYD